MNDNNHIRLELLLFSICGTHFGVEAEQITGIELYDGKQADDLFWFHEELEYATAAPAYCSPTVVSIKTGDAPTYRVIIDSMEDIAEFSQKDIHLFPALVEPFAVRRGLWGVLLHNGIMVMLVDFRLLLNHKRSTIH